jgi:hypothetical protein
VALRWKASSSVTGSVVAMAEWCAKLDDGADGKSFLNSDQTKDLEHNSAKSDLRS